MFLSIIIPCYNCEGNISLLLDKLKEQIDSLNSEVILINDGSTDNTSDIIIEYISKNNLPNFSIYSYPNSGAAKARTIGLDKALGDYVFFIDSDDRVADGFYDAIFSAASTYPDMIYFSSSSFSNGTGTQFLSNKIKISETTVYHDSDIFFRTMLANNIWTCAVWSFVFRRKHALNSRAYFTNRIAHEDILFTLRMLGQSKKIYAIKDVLYNQIETIGSLTRSTKNKDYILDRISAYEESVDDISCYFSPSVMKKYKQWSIDSIKSLVINNKRLIPSLLLNINVYKFLCKNFIFIFITAISMIKYFFRRRSIQ